VVSVFICGRGAVGSIKGWFRTVRILHHFRYPAFSHASLHAYVYSTAHVAITVSRDELLASVAYTLVERYCYPTYRTKQMLIASGTSFPILPSSWKSTTQLDINQVQTSSSSSHQTPYLVLYLPSTQSRYVVRSPNCREAQ